MDDQDPSVSAESPYRSNHRLVRWIGGKHDDHSSFGPAVFTAAALYFLIQIIVAWVFTPSYSLVKMCIRDRPRTEAGHLDPMTGEGRDETEDRL